MTSIDIPLCASCRHLVTSEAKGWYCKAFPRGIPDDIFNGTLDHRQPVEHDRGVQYERDPDSKAPLPGWVMAEKK